MGRSSALTPECAAAPLVQTVGRVSRRRNPPFASRAEVLRFRTTNGLLATERRVTPAANPPYFSLRCRNGVDAAVKTLYSPLPSLNRAHVFFERFHREVPPHRQNRPTHEGSGRVRACLGDGVAGHLRRRRSRGPSDELSTARSERGLVASGRGRRRTCIGRAHPPSSVRRGPDSERIRAFFISDSTGLCIGAGQRSMDRPATASSQGSAL